jgi:hypothetical protein
MGSREGCADLRTLVDAPSGVLTPGQRAASGVDLLPDAQDTETVRAKRRARDEAARAAGASPRSVQQFKRVKQEAPELAEQVRAGTIALDRAERLVRDRAAEQRRIEQAREDAKRLPEQPRVTIHHGDFRETLADLRDVDAIITDPPYPKEFLPLLSDLATWADKVLKPDGVLAVLFGQTHLPDVYRLLEGGRPYRWTMAYMTPGVGYIAHHRKTVSNWKPVLVYGGGPRLVDVVTSQHADTRAKDLHEWGQDVGAFTELIERLSRPGDTIVDPFMGSGTTLLAARSLGRHSIGADIDAEHVATARKRLQ